MPIALRSPSLRLRLLMLGAVSVTGVLALAVSGFVLMSGISTKTHTSSQALKNAQLLSHAYESWIFNDDQNNMYAAVVALRDPSQHSLAEVTWKQAVDAYVAAKTNLAALRPLLRDPSQLAQLGRIDASLASYNTFSLATRKAALAGDVRKTVYGVTVANLVPSNALPVEFTQLRSSLEAQAKRSQDSVQQSASTGTWVMILVTLLTLPLLLFVIFMTIRSTRRSIAPVLDRLRMLMDRTARPT
jgi:hypothetical protein